MDPFGVLLAALALAAYPGGIFLIAQSRMVVTIAGLPPAQRGWEVADLPAMVAIGGAAALAPLPGSPATTLPPVAGAAPNLIVVAVLAAAAIALAHRTPWQPLTSIGLMAVGASVLALPAVAGSLSLLAIAAVPGPAIEASRVLVAAGLAVTAPLGADLSGPAPRIVRGALLTLLLLLGAALVVPAGIHDLAAVAAAAVVAAWVLVAAAAVRLARLWGAASQLALGSAGAALGVAAIAVAALAPR